MPGELSGLTQAVAAALLPLRAVSRQRIGLPEAGRPALLCALANEHPGTLLAVAATPARSQGLLDELRQFVSPAMPLARLPERERLPYELARDDDALVLERSRALAALRGERGIVVASWLALAEHCAGPDAAGQAVEVSVGSQLPPDALVASLEAVGYRVEALADRPGAVARRGGIVDVFAADGQYALRVEFFGSQVESIREIDISTQRSLRKLDQATLPALATGTEAARTAARSLARKLEGASEEADALIEQLEIVAGGGRGEFAAALEPLLHETTALDHIPTGALVVIDDAPEGAASLGAVWEHERRTQEELERRGSIPPGLPPLIAPPEVMAGRLALHIPTVEIDRFGAEEFGTARLGLGVVPSFAGKLRTLVEQAGEWARQGRTVVVASQQALRLAELLEEEGISARHTRAVTEPPAPGTITLVPLAIAGGFTMGESLVLVTDTEIFGLRKRRRPTRTRTGVREDLVSTLEVGDYLVHADHGIARFGGLVRRTMDGTEREYLELQYAEGDRL
ncbi:MAG: CarD family transcriptional regulator, partial [Dehalococcoidia bacterium]